MTRPPQYPRARNRRARAILSIRAGSSRGDESANGPPGGEAVRWRSGGRARPPAIPIPVSGRPCGRHDKPVRRLDAELHVEDLDRAIELVVVALVHRLDRKS